MAEASIGLGGFSPAQLERYSRQMLLREVGGTGQARLLAAGVQLHAAPGFGRWTALSITGAGVGHLALDLKEGGQALIDTLAELNPDTETTLLAPGQPPRFPIHLLLSLGEEASTRLERIACARTLALPLLCGWRGPGAVGWIGGYDPRRPEEGCPACPLSAPPPLAGEAAPLLEPLLAGWLEMMVAEEVLMELLGAGRGWRGVRWQVNAQEGGYVRCVQKRSPHCPLCGPAPGESILMPIS